MLQAIYKIWDNVPKLDSYINESLDIAYLIAACDGISVISYTDPNMGSHVVVSYVRKGDKTFYFYDANKGDVTLNFPNSAKWLSSYFNIFIKKCGHITITNYTDHWDEALFKTQLQNLYKDALKFDPYSMGEIIQHSKDDFHQLRKNKFNEEYLLYKDIL